MTLPNNHVGQTPSTSPNTKLGRRRHLNMDTIREHDSNYNTINSVKTPSIIGLENLTLQPSEEYSVDIPVQPHSIRHAQLSTKAPIQAFQPTITPRWEGRKKSTVYVTVVFLKIGEIDTIKEYFEADVYIQSKWREPVLDQTKTKVSDFNQFWNPELVLQNVFEDLKEKMWHEVRYSPSGEAFIFEMRRVKGKFFETMELNHFPFDIQTMSVVITSELTKKNLEILEDTDELSCIYVDCFSDSQEWTLHNFVELDALEIVSQYTRARHNCPGLVASCCASRKSGFFAWNVLVIINMLNIFAFTTFAVDPELTQNRLQLSFILLLAAISFRFVTNQNIPKISYLTHLDRYVLLSMMFSGFITFWHAIQSLFSTRLQNEMNLWAFIVFGVLYLIFNILYIAFTFLQRRANLNEIRQRELHFEDKARHILGDMWSAFKQEVDSTTFLGKIKKKMSRTRMG